MSDKEKRKTNPRRRLLLKLILGIALITTLISLGIYVLRPTGTQIVFIAPDDNGIDQIWLADLNNPEHPKQLTSDSMVTEIQVGDESHLLVYTTHGENSSQLIWLLNMLTNERQLITECRHPQPCHRMTFHSNGHWLAYQTEDFVHIYDTQLQVEIAVHSVESSPSHYIDNRSIAWIPQSNLLYYRFRTSITEPNATRIYDPETEQVVDTASEWGWAPYPPEFAPNGRYFALIHPLTYGILQRVDIYPLDNPESMLFSTHTEPEELNSLYVDFQDWSPDGEAFLGGRVLFAAASLMRSELALHHILSEDVTPLMTTNTNMQQQLYYVNASFNYDASLVLYRLSDSNYYSEHQLMLYDMETGEEIALPLFGHSPQWVNGGR